MTLPDLEPAARRLADLVVGVGDDQLGAPTPCPAYSLGDLVEHVGGLALAFTAAATKSPIEGGAQGPSGDASRLEVGWRQRIPNDLDALVQAWRDPDAWTGMTEAGGIALPGEVAGVVALDELVLHGWDVARSSGQPFECDETTLQAVHGFVASFSAPDQAEQRAGLFGPVVEVPDDAPLLDRVLGLSGRDPSWSPSSRASPNG
jgi:uncharacterized protein (TIGR03086 family)